MDWCRLQTLITKVFPLGSNRSAEYVGYILLIFDYIINRWQEDQIVILIKIDLITITIKMTINIAIITVLQLFIEIEYLVKRSF